MIAGIKASTKPVKQPKLRDSSCVISNFQCMFTLKNRNTPNGHKIRLNSINPTIKARPLDGGAGLSSAFRSIFLAIVIPDLFGNRLII